MKNLRLAFKKLHGMILNMFSACSPNWAPNKCLYAWNVLQKSTGGSLVNHLGRETEWAEWEQGHCQESELLLTLGELWEHPGTAVGAAIKGEGSHAVAPFSLLCMCVWVGTEETGPWGKGNIPSQESFLLGFSRKGNANHSVLQRKMQDYAVHQ